MADSEIIIDANELMHSVRLGVRMPRAFGLRIWAATKLFELAGLVSGTNVVVEFNDGYDEADAGTWERYGERTPDDGAIVLVRYPEGYRLRYNGETVWQQ